MRIILSLAAGLVITTCCIRVIFLLCLLLWLQTVLEQVLLVKDILYLRHDDPPNMPLLHVPLDSLLVLLEAHTKGTLYRLCQLTQLQSQLLTLLEQCLLIELLLVR